MHDNKIPPRNELLTEKELAELWGVSLSTLQHWRCASGGKVGPRYYKIGFRVFYHIDDSFEICNLPNLNDGEAILYTNYF